MSIEITFLIENKTNTLDDVKEHGLLGKIIRFFYFLEEDRYFSELDRNSSKFRRVLHSHFQKREIQQLFSECINAEIKSDIWKENSRIQTFLLKNLVYFFFYYQFLRLYICDLHEIWGYHQRYMDSNKFLFGLVGRIRQGRHDRFIQCVYHFPLPKVLIIEILSFLFNIQTNL
jgi:hypothetical protein